MNIQSFQDVLAALRQFTDREGPDAAAKRRRILHAAAALFERHGYQRASISAIAREAAVAKGTVYLYFSSKADILLHVLMWERGQLYEAIAPAMEAACGPRERLRALLAQAFLKAEAMPVSNRLKQGDPALRAALAEVDLAELSASLGLFQRIFVWLVAEAAPDLPEAVQLARAQTLMITLQAVPALLRARGELPLEVFAARFSDMLVDGALAPVQGKEAL